MTAPEEVFTLYTESKEMSLVRSLGGWRFFRSLTDLRARAPLQTGLLCNDLLVLVKMPPAPFDSDPNAPVELYTVLRLTGGRSALQGGHHRAKPPASLDGPDDRKLCGSPGCILINADGGFLVLRLKIGDKAVCYFRCAADPYKNRKEALAWTSAINLQWEVNT